MFLTASRGVGFCFLTEIVSAVVFGSQPLATFPYTSSVVEGVDVSIREWKTNLESIIEQ